MSGTSRVHLESSAVSSDFQLHALRGFEAIEKFFEFEIELIATGQTPLDEAALLAAPATLVFTRGDDGQVERKIYGVVHSVRDFFLTESRHLGYAMTFAPRAWPMMHNKRSEIFLDVAVPDVIKTKLQRAALDLGSDAEFRLLGSYPTREFIMQYEETDLEFCSRLCEHVGISFFFEHKSGKDVIVFSDDNSGFSPIEGDATVAFFARGEQYGVFALEGRTKTIPAKYYLKDYNYRTPTVALVAQTDVDPAGRGDVIEYGAHFKTVDEGNQIVAIRADELRATKRVLTGKSDVPRIASGAKFTLDGHPRQEGELLVTEVRHEATQATGAAAKGDERSYTNEFRAIQSSVAYRPPRVTPKPRVHGAITGVIEAAAPSQYSELDDQGRYHVRFMLDQGDAPQGKASSLLRMAQPHAGPGYGHHFPLRDGVEVLLTFIDGDPDRPIITSAVPNPQTPSTVSGKNGVHNVMRTGGGTVLDIDDTEGSTAVTLATPFAATSLTMGASAAGIFLSTGQNAVLETGESITLLAGTKIDVTAQAGDLTETASANVGIEAKGGDVKVTGSANVVVTAKSAQAQVEGQTGVILTGHPKVNASAVDILLDAGSTVTVKAGTSAVITAPLTTLQGKATVTVSSGALAMVNAPTVMVSGSAVMISGASGVVITGGAVSITGSTVDIKGGTIKLNT